MPPFRRAQNMDQECIIVEFYDGLLLNKHGYPTIDRFIKGRITAPPPILRLKLKTECLMAVTKTTKQ